MTAVTLLDGGLGQEISKRSGKSAHALWSVKVMMEQPAIVEDVHRAFLDAGADALTVNSYTTTPSRLARNGFPEWFDDAQQLALRLVNNARDQADRPVQVTGCLPPLVATYVTEESKPYEGSLEEYRKICAHQGEQVDVMFIETIGIIAEAMAAIDAAKETGKPVYLGYTISDDGSNTLRSGERLEEAAEAAAQRGVAGIMINCSIPEAVTSAMPILAKTGVRFGGYANGFTSIEALRPGGNVDSLEARKDLNPEAYGKFVRQWLDHGASIIGGCCEVGPQHIAYLNKMLNDENVERQAL